MSQVARINNVIRLQFVNRQSFLWIPLIVFVSSLVFAFFISAMVPGTDPKYGGAGLAPIMVFLVVGINAMTLSFPFSQSVGLARWEFYIGTLVAAVIGAAALASVFIVEGVIEHATHGFGINGYFSYLPWLWELGWWSAWLNFFVFALLAFVLGFWGATVFKRWGMMELFAIGASIGLAFALALYLISRAGVWGTVLTWLSTAGSLQLTGWLALVTTVLAGVSYLTLRRAVP